MVHNILYLILVIILWVNWKTIYELFQIITFFNKNCFFYKSNKISIKLTYYIFYIILLNDCY